MGSYSFSTFNDGENLEQAFSDARDAAAWEHGHGGYTGTIAEKGEVVVIQRTPLASKDAHALADEMITFGDPRIDDKWGPAGAIRIKDDEHDGWLFFGHASS